MKGFLKVTSKLVVSFSLDRNSNGGGIMLFVRKDILAKLIFIIVSPIEVSYVKINLRKQKWLVCCSYNPNKDNTSPGNICWSSRHLQDMSWRRLQHVFSVTIFRLPRRLEDVLQIRLEDVLEDKKLLRWRRLEDVLKTCLEDISWRRLQDVSEANKIFTGDICI